VAWLLYAFSEPPRWRGSFAMEEKPAVRVAVCVRGVVGSSAAGTQNLVRPERRGNEPAPPTVAWLAMRGLNGRTRSGQHAREAGPDYAP
jgi:hypothetical protein